MESDQCIYIYVCIACIPALKAANHDALVVSVASSGAAAVKNNP